MRNKLSLASIRREADVYRRLKGIPGIPRCYGCLDDRYLVLEHIQGDTLDALDVGLTNRETFYARLLETLRTMHDAGVAHGDLKRKRNILVGPGEQPFVIDFGIAVVADDQRGFLFDLVRQVDRNAWIKHKYRATANGHCRRRLTTLQAHALGTPDANAETGLASSNPPSLAKTTPKNAPNLTLTTKGGHVRNRLVSVVCAARGHGRPGAPRTDRSPPGMAGYV